VTDPTNATVIDAVFAMNAYEHNPDGSWSFDDRPQITCYDVTIRSKNYERSSAIRLVGCENLHRRESSPHRSLAVRG
jgi:hypothetical protein